MLSFVFLATLAAVVNSVYLEQQLDSVVTLGWDIDNANGYCAIGLRKTMYNTDMFAALSDSTTVSINDYWSTGHPTPGMDVSQGGTTDYFYVSGGLDSSGYINVVLSRKLHTGDQYDQDIIPDSFAQLCWAYKGSHSGSNSNHDHDSGGWEKHSTYNFGTIVWATSTNTMFFHTDTENKTLHGVLMSLAWVLSSFIGIGSARFFKNRSWWFYVHFFCMMFTSLITIISASAMAKDDMITYGQENKSQFLHSRMGMILSSLVISQVLFGMLTSFFKLFTKNTHATILLIRAHKTVGYAMFIAGLINCMSGWIEMGGGVGLAGVAIGYVVIVIVFGCCEGWQMFSWNRLVRPDASLTEMTHFKVTELIREGKKLMFADELVVDVGNFLKSHPGGEYFITECIGEDSGKYMVGCSSFGSNLNPHTHSDKAFSMLKTLAVGRIPPPVDYMQAIRDTGSVFMEFYVKERKVLNSHTNLLYLKSDDWKMSKTCQSPTWLGKHFMTAYRNKLKYVKRYYSSVFVDLFQWAEELGITGRTPVQNEDGVVKLIFKVYPGGKMTNHLYELKPGELVLLKGPIGPGLMLQELNGKYLALGGGTGLVPFLDLVHVAWKTFGRQCEFFNLSLFVFFREWKDGFGLDILEKVKENCTWLDLHIVTDQHPNKKGVAEEVEEKVKGGLDLVWICGPSGFNRNYYDLAIRSGMVRNKVILM